MKSRGFINYQGGKTYLANKIIGYFDYKKTIYLELFFGGGSILWAKPKHKIEIVNDIHADLMNLYFVVKEHFDEFYEKVNSILYDENLFHYYKNNLPKDKIERAAVFFFLINTSFSGTVNNIRTFSYCFTHNKATTFSNKIKSLKFYHNRLRDVQIVNKDFKSLLTAVIANKQFDICIYADPPYMNLEDYYKGNFSYKDHLKLAEMLNIIHDNGGHVVVSYVYNPVHEKLYPKDKFYYFFFDSVKHSSYHQGIENKERYQELLIVSKK